MPKITLLAHTYEPERLIAAAAKLCYSPVGVDELMDGLNQEKSADFVEMLSSYGHESPTEHCTFTFAVEGVSRAFLAQVTRHRIASYSVQSQRYVAESDFAYVTPPEIEQNEEAKAVFSQAMEDARKHYQALAGILTEKHMGALTEAGESEKAARGRAKKMAIEDARFVLPNACDTKMIMTMNARSLQNFFRHRCCNRAQWEIRSVADEMLRLSYGAAPTLFLKSGPPCVQGNCPEGKMSCGRIEEVRSRCQAIKDGAAHG